MTSLLFLPGNMCDERLWGPIGERLDQARIAWDVANFSQCASIEAMAERTLDAHSTTVIPVGFSMGAIVALEMWRQAPQQIAALGLIALNAGADLPERAVVRPRQQADVRAGHLARVVSDELKPHYFAPGKRDDRALLALTMEMALALGPDTFVRQSEALRTRLDLRDVLPTIDIPALLACGAEDALCPPTWHADWATAIGPTASVSVVAGAGHLLPLEQPDALSELLIGWHYRIKEPV